MFKWVMTEFVVKHGAGGFKLLGMGGLLAQLLASFVK